MRRLSEKVNVHTYCDTCKSPIFENEEYYTLSTSKEVCTGDSITVKEANVLKCFCKNCGLPKAYKPKQKGFDYNLN
jgi:hypothetical protein